MWREIEIIWFKLRSQNRNKGLKWNHPISLQFKMRYISYIYAALASLWWAAFITYHTKLWASNHCWHMLRMYLIAYPLLSGEMPCVVPESLFPSWALGKREMQFIEQYPESCRPSRHPCECVFHPPPALASPALQRTHLLWSNGCSSTWAGDLGRNPWNWAAATDTLPLATELLL